MKKPRLLVGATSLVFFFIIWKLYGIESVSGVQDLKEEIEYQENINRFPLSLERNLNPVTVYCVTPTYWRYVQKAELIQVLQTLTLASFRVNIKWIVIEDSEEKTALVTNLLSRIDDAGDSRLSYVHLNAKTPPFQQLKAKDPRWKKHRGVEQRNAALKWIRDNVKPHGSKKIIFFMDDDNTYDVKLFEEIAKVNKVGVWPVGLVGGLNLETPIVDPNTGEVIKFKSGWQSKRVFSLDMAGFALNVELILNKTEVMFSYKSEVGYLENDFLSAFVEKRNLEPLAKNCTKVYVWHTRTLNPATILSKVTGYKSGWKADRPFAIDMAGFGINIDIILEKQNAVFSYRMEKGFQESQFLAYFTTKEQLEPLADNCTKVYVWHTRTEKPGVKGIVPGFEV